MHSTIFLTYVRMYVIRGFHFNRDRTSLHVYFSKNRNLRRLEDPGKYIRSWYLRTYVSPLHIYVWLDSLETKHGSAHTGWHGSGRLPATNYFTHHLPSPPPISKLKCFPGANPQLTTTQFLGKTLTVHIPMYVCSET